MCYNIPLTAAVPVQFLQHATPYYLPQYFPLSLMCLKDKQTCKKTKTKTPNQKPFLCSHYKFALNLEKVHSVPSAWNYLQDALYLETLT